MRQPRYRTEADTTLPEWVAYLFDHPVSDEAWYWGSDDVVELAPAAMVRYLTEMLEDCDALFAPYSDAQLDQGLWGLLHQNLGYLGVLADSELSVESRVRCIESFGSLYRNCFAARCSDTLSHLDERTANALNTTCYMWWDVLPLHGRPGKADQADVDASCLSVMEQTLKLGSIACQESALHGLGHWAIYYPTECQEIINRYLSNVGDIRRELYDYSVAAKRGMVN